jgi:hypothetical protein
MQTCVQQHHCALKSIVASMAFERGEDRRQQNDRAWSHILRNAEKSGDSLDYDGPLTWA